jgi:cell volume regulation protein A
MARRLGVALRQTVPNTSRVEIDIPGQVEQEIAGYPVTGDSVILGLSRLPAFARLLMLVRKGHILDATAAGGLQPGDYAYFLVPRERLARLDSLFRESPEVARRLGLLFGELPIRGETTVGEVMAFYDLDLGAEDPSASVADWLAARLGDKPALDATLPIPGGRMVVRRIESGRVSSVGLQLDELLQVEPDEALLRRLDEEDEDGGGTRRWLASLLRRRAEG